MQKHKRELLHILKTYTHTHTYNKHTYYIHFASPTAAAVDVVAAGVAGD